ncbi:MAG: tetratricopeptide repeat protein [Hyphomonadaceae bacterium]
MRASPFSLMAFSVAALTLAFGGGLAFAAGAGGGGGGDFSAPRQNDPQRAYREGIEALQAGNYPTAVARLRTVLDATPRDPNVNYVYALALIGNGDGEDARRPLERAIRADNGPPDARRLMGILDLQANQRDAAIAQQTALADMLTACDAQCGDQRRGQIQSALDALTQAIEAGAANPVTDQQSWLIPSEPEGRAAYAAAVGLINAQRFEEALAALETAQAAIGPHPDILNYMGFASRRLGRTDEALLFYREALALDPEHRGANEYLGELYLQLGLIDQARLQLARLDRLCPYGCAEREELARWIDTASR